MNVSDVVKIIKASKNLGLKSISWGELEITFSELTASATVPESESIAISKPHMLTQLESSSDVDEVIRTEINEQDLIREYVAETLMIDDPLQYEMSLKSQGNN